MEQEPSVFTRLATPTAAHIMTPVWCPHCQQKQVVQVLAGAGTRRDERSVDRMSELQERFPCYAP